MAIRNASGAAAGLIEDTGLPALSDFAITGLCSVAAGNPGGEAFIFRLQNSSGQYLGLTCDVNAGPVVTVRFSWSGGWEELTANLTGLNTFFAFGVDCAGVGTNGVTIMLSTGPGATPLSFTRTLGGSTWTPNALRLLFDTALSRGVIGTIQNIKYGDRGLNAAQMHAEAWSLTNQNPGLWTPTITEMVTGDLTAQREGFEVVSPIDIQVAPGYFADTGGGTPPTITFSTATISGDAVTVAGTITSAAVSQQVNVEFVRNSEIVRTAPVPLTGTSWASTFDSIGPGVYTIRARVTDALGSSTSNFASPVEIIGLSGTDEIPYIYTTTSLLAVPSALAIAVGQTATVRAVNQSGAPVPGAVVTSNATSGAPIASTPDFTDLDGNLVVTASTSGTATLVLSVVNQAGATLSATVPINVGGASISTVTVSPSSASIFAGQTQQFNSVIVGGGTTTWSVVSGLGSINSSGLYTAPAGATTAIIRGARTGDPSVYDEAQVTVSAAAPASIGAIFLTAPNIFSIPGGDISWRIRVEVNGQPVQGAVVTPVAGTPGIMTFSVPPTTAADGTTTISASIGENVATGIVVAVALNIVVNGLLMALNAVVTVSDTEFGYVEIRGRRYPRPYPQKT